MTCRKDSYVCSCVGVIRPLLIMPHFRQSLSPLTMRRWEGVGGDVEGQLWCVFFLHCRWSANDRKWWVMYQLRDRELNMKLFCYFEEHPELQSSLFMLMYTCMIRKVDDNESEPGFVLMSWTPVDLMNEEKVHVRSWLFSLWKKKCLGWFFT